MRGTSDVVEVYAGQERIAVHARVAGLHRTAAQAEHHAGIPLGGLRTPAKLQVRIRPLGPEVEVRSPSTSARRREVHDDPPGTVGDDAR